MTDATHPNDCGCCEGVNPQTPALIFNRPGLPEIAYRAGNYAQLRASMLAGLTRGRRTPLDPNLFCLDVLPSIGRPALANLRTRAEDDLTIALIDAWAVTGDVLSFYIERAANEQYLPTATERRSLAELLEVIGYRLRPGVAAETHLAFTLETPPVSASGASVPVPGLPRSSLVTMGTQVQSIPGPGEVPQTFETIEDLTALADWNTLTPVMNKLASDLAEPSAYFAGAALNLKSGDELLFVDEAQRWARGRVTSISADAAANRTHVKWTWENSPPDPPSFANKLRVFALPQKAALFGYNAPNPLLFSDEVKRHLEASLTDDKTEWNFGVIDQEIIFLDALYEGAVPHGYALLINGDTQAAAAIEKIAQVSKSDYALSAKVTEITFDALDNAGEFGGEHTRKTSVLLSGEEFRFAHAPFRDPVFGSAIEVIESLDLADAPRSILIRGRRARLKLPPGDGVPAGGGSPLPADQAAVVLEVDEHPERAGANEFRWKVLLSNGNETTFLAAPSAIDFIAASAGDPVIGEVAVVKEIASGDDGPVLQLLEPLKHVYDRHLVEDRTVEIFGNVTPATHGETVREEVLGNGDASKPGQRFTLRKAPLTYIPTSTALGGESTLTLRVNGITWHEAESLFGRGARDRVYVTTINETGQTVLLTGDGINGARLPSGNENVRAIYRVGIGKQGEVKHDQLSLLMTRPLGVKAVTNPLSPTGAQDPQEQDDARENAPLTVRTLDRIVSLKDYEDFARNFSGVGKAMAVWTWDGSHRGVHVTVAGTDGALVQDTDPLLKNLVAAMTKYGNTHVRFAVKGYRQATFTLRATLIQDTDYLPAEVLADVGSALAQRFSFKARSFGQLVALSEVIEVIQNRPGVIAVDVTRLHKSSEAPSLNSYIRAAAPLPGASLAEPGAELLTLDPAALENLEVSP